jgi:hypothetical protein
MAGTLLLHCGIDLFVEGIYDSFGKYDCEWTACTYLCIQFSLYSLDLFTVDRPRVHWNMGDCVSHDTIWHGSCVSCRSRVCTLNIRYSICFVP